MLTKLYQNYFFSRTEGESQRRKSIRQKETASLLEKSDVDVPNDLACLFFFVVDNRWSKVLIKHGKRWPAGMTNEEKLSLCEGDFVEIKCGPKYNIRAQGEFLPQGDERSIGKTVNEIC